MKRINKTTLMIFALVLSLSVTVGASLAYFSDYEEASGGATLNLGGKTQIDEGKDNKQKDIVIKNTGETNMIVRVMIAGEGVKYLANPPKYEKADWEKVKEGDIEWYYYKKVLEPGQETSDILAKMEFSWQGEEPSYNFEITVAHESAQAVYNGKTLAAPKGWNQSIVKAIKLPVTNSGKEGE